MRATEARLREALEDRASQVTDDTLVRNHSDPTRTVIPLDARRDKRRNRVLVLVAAAVAFILAGFSWLVFVNRQSVPANPLPTVVPVVPTQSLPVPSTSANATEDPSGSASEPPDTSRIAGSYQRSAIPWRVVGAGWSVATHVDAQTSPSMTLVLVSRWGASYSIGTYPTGDILDVSRDGHRVMLGTSNSFSVVYLPSGAAGVKMSFPNNDPYLVNGRFIRPDGLSFVLLMAFPKRQTFQLDWFPNQDTSISQSLSTDIQFLRASADGRYLVGDRYEASDSVVVLDAATGNRVRAAQAPTGENNCSTSNWWSDDEIVVFCPASGVGGTKVWRYSISTGAMTAIAQSPDGSYDWAYPSTLGTVVQHAFGCSNQPIGVLDSGGTTDTPLLEQPHPGGPGSLYAVVGTTAYLFYYSTCGTNGGTGAVLSSLIAYDLISHTTVTLVAGNTTGAGVQSAFVLR